MKEAVSDVFKLIEKSTGDIIKDLKALLIVSQHHNVNIIELNDYFDKEQRTIRRKIKWHTKAQ